jgi:hypothetical protein
MSHGDQDRRRKGCRMSFMASLCIVALFLGAAVTVLVAWGVALWAPLSRMVGPAPVQVSFHPAHGIIGPEHQEITRCGFGLTSRQHFWFVESHEMASTDRPRIWVGAGERRWGQFEMKVYEAGWPIRVLRAVELTDQAERGPNGAALRQPGTIAAGLTDAERHLPPLLQLHTGRTLPLEPIWKPFIASTLLYGGVPLILICGRFWVRQHFRRRHGLCLTCAYPLGSAERCPECGAVAEPAVQKEALA